MSPAPASAPYPTQPSAHKHWCNETRKRLHYRRADDPGWEGSRCTPLPHPSWLVEDWEYREGVPPHLCRDALSDSQRRIYQLMRDIGKGKYNRPAVGGRAQIVGRKNGESDWTIHASLGAMASILGMPVVTLRDNLQGLLAKHHVVRLEVRSRGEGRGKNRVESVYRLPPFNDVLAAIRADPNIATTHGDKDPRDTIQWDNGRSNSRKFFTPAQVDQWALATLPPKPKPVERSKVEPADADRQLAAAAPLVSVPRKRAELPAVPADQAAAIASLCGRIVGARFNKFANPVDPIPTDHCPAMLAGAQALARAKGKEFPAEALVDLCNRVFNKAKQRERCVMVNGNGDDAGVEEMFVWKVDMPAAYLLTCCTTDSETVEATLDARERRAKRAAMEERERVLAAIGNMRQHPGDVAIWQHAEQLSREFPDLWAELYAADDVKHGGDGQGSSWRAVRPPAAKVERGLKGDALLADLLKKAGGPSS